MKVLIALFSISILTSVGACTQIPPSSTTQTDKFSPSYIKQHIVVGKTTQAEVVALYGNSNSKQIKDDGRETWFYNESTVSTPNVMERMGGMLSGVTSGLSQMGLSTAQNSVGVVSDQVNGANRRVNGAKTAINSARDEKAANGSGYAHQLFIDFNSKGIVTHWWY
ncbi:hypothetical protein LJ656_34615 [Paraburkholderia sp. MMS20-SJTR3]|uniref:Lipoprotein n=1 Tax=Paraburkholderia sejongensis TaxID=2886946 RepID=A0ABS8K680_9BURK|nr:hypothetical protein [Paraburkholderia sp. MMS20-SJTR3]MCC8397672.1 hypothetical protein [Paraburkholderia sp. MMS20-SJTR3]